MTQTTPSPNSGQTPATGLIDYDLPGNDLDPKTPSSTERKKIPLAAKIYGILCLADGVATLLLTILGAAIIIWALFVDPHMVAIGSNPLKAFILTIASTVLGMVSALSLIIFGRSLIKDRRRNAARISYVLIALTIIEIITGVMLYGIGVHLIRPAVSLVILLALSITIDPTLRQERELQRRLRDMLDRDAAAEGLLGRDVTGEGYIKLNFFNLFWVFTVCSILGLVLEIIWHMAVVDPGVYQDRAGLLFGPFSPIYGCGAVLMTVALNRFYKKNPLIIFLISAVIGGLFEVAVSLFMQTGFGAVAWDYSHQTLFGFPDPIAVLFGGRTSTTFAIMWGLLGLTWIKVLLPRLLNLINMIPWKMRYSFTSLCAVLMLVNAFMTLQSLDFWFERVSGIEPSTPVAQFYAKHFDNDYMAHRFQSMTIHPDDSGRADGSKAVKSVAESAASNA